MDISKAGPNQSSMKQVSMSGVEETLEIPARLKKKTDYINLLAGLISGSEYSKAMLEQEHSVDASQFRKMELYNLHVPSYAIKCFIEDAYDEAFECLDDKNKNQKMAGEIFKRKLIEKAKKLYEPRSVEASDVFTEKEIEMLSEKQKTKTIPAQYIFKKDYEKFCADHEEYDQEDIETCIKKYPYASKSWSFHPTGSWKDSRLKRYSIGNSKEDYDNLIKNINTIAPYAQAKFPLDMQ